MAALNSEQTLTGVLSVALVTMAGMVRANQKNQDRHVEQRDAEIAKLNVEMRKLVGELGEKRGAAERLADESERAAELSTKLGEALRTIERLRDDLRAREFEAISKSAEIEDLRARLQEKEKHEESKTD